MMMGLLRRDKPSIAAAFIGIMLFGGMFLGVLPQKEGISWEYHLSGAVAGLLSAIFWHKIDPAPPRKVYSWEEDDADDGVAEDQESLEPPRPDAVPILWHRPENKEPVILLFRRPNLNGIPDKKEP